MKMRSIQALRAIAALLVVGAHFPRLEAKLFPNGFMHGFGTGGAIGVDLFFVISGFIMITTTWDGFGKSGAAGSFLTRRFLRIYPAYWVAFFTFVTIGVVFPAALFLGPVNAASVVTSIFLIPHAGGPLMFVAWSLEFEVYFYIVFALALHFTKARLPFSLGIWCGLTLILNAAAYFVDNQFISFAGSPLALEFMAGVIVGYLIIHKHIVAPRLALVAGVAAAAAVAIYSARWDGFGTMELAWFRVLAAGPAMVLIVYGAVSLEELGHVQAPRFAVALGDASYTMYLWHGMLLGAYTAVWSHLHLRGWIGDALYIFGGASLIVVGSLSIYRFVEAPLTAGAKHVFRAARNFRRVAVSAP